MSDGVVVQLEAAAIPVVNEMIMELRQQRRDVLSERSLLFGGHAAPQLDVPYQVTVKDNRDSCHAISMMKVSASLANQFSMSTGNNILAVEAMYSVSPSEHLIHHELRASVSTVLTVTG